MCHWSWGTRYNGLPKEINKLAICFVLHFPVLAGASEMVGNAMLTGGDEVIETARFVSLLDIKSYTNKKLASSPGLPRIMNL